MEMGAREIALGVAAEILSENQLEPAGLVQFDCFGRFFRIDVFPTSTALDADQLDREVGMLEKPDATKRFLVIEAFLVLVDCADPRGFPD